MSRRPQLIIKERLCEVCNTKRIPDDGLTHCCTPCVQSNGKKHGKFCDKVFPAIRRI